MSRHFRIQNRQNNTAEIRTTKNGGHDDTIYVFVAASWTERARELSHSARNPDDVANEIYGTQSYFTWPEIRAIVHGALAGTQVRMQNDRCLAAKKARLSIFAV